MNTLNTMEWSEPELPLDGGPPTIKNHSVTYHNGLLYCFGGYDGRRNHMTLMVFSLEYQRWTSVSHESIDDVNRTTNSTGHDVDGEGSTENETSISIPPSQNSRLQSGSDSVKTYRVVGTPPPGRNGHTATLAHRIGSNGEVLETLIFIIGGWLGSGPLAASDMHILDISNPNECLRWSPVRNVKGTPPGPCNMHSADFVKARNEIYVFRGGNGREYLNDLHAMDVDTYTWRLVETRGEAPLQRANHSSAVLEDTMELFIFGGWNGKERLNDIHILDTATSTWSRPHVGGVLPHPRAGMTLTALRGRLYLFGGSGTCSKCFQDLQIFDRQEMAWLDVTQQESSFFASSSPEAASSGGGGRRSKRYHSNESQRNGAARTAADDSLHGSSSTATKNGGGFHKHADWRTQDLMKEDDSSMHYIQMAASPIYQNAANPNDEESVPSIIIHGKGPGRRAGHTATAVNQHIYIFGGSCGSDYLNDFFVLDTDPTPHTTVTEPTSLQLIERRLRHFYNDEEFSDVTFIVEGQRVHGHRMVLCLVSDCFRAMFTTGFRESSSGCTIDIPNCSYRAFMMMMEYIYSGECPKIDVTNNDENGAGSAIEMAVDLLGLADQFFLDHLKQLCEKCLQRVVNEETIEYLLHVSQKTNSKQLESCCRHFERNQGSMVD